MIRDKIQAKLEGGAAGLRRAFQYFDEVRRATLFCRGLGPCQSLGPCWVPGFGTRWFVAKHCHNPSGGSPSTAPSHTGSTFGEEGRHFAVCLFAHTRTSQRAGPFPVARLKMDLPFHDRLAYTRARRRSASPRLSGGLFSE